MKINYADIMARATTRCADLEAFADYAAQSKQMADELLYAARYFVFLRNKMRSLDPESVDLLGGIEGRLETVGCAADCLMVDIEDALAKLLEALK